MRKTLPMTGIPENFQLTEKTLERLARDHFSVDVEKTLDKFILNAEAKGWMYRNWQSAFLNYVDNGGKYGGVFYKLGKEQDPKWLAVLNEVRPYGFRAPLQHETPGAYRTAFELWKSNERRSENVIPMRQFT